MPIVMAAYVLTNVAYLVVLTPEDIEYASPAVAVVIFKRTFIFAQNVLSCLK